MQIDVYNSQIEKIGKTSLPDPIFKAKINQTLMAQAVRVFLSNQRRAKAKSKRRGEIKLSNRKIYRQKGTGNARHGDRKAPLFVKGAKAHGPTGEQNYQLKMSKKMKKKALFSALTTKLKNKKIIVIKDLEKVGLKTKNMAKTMNKIRVQFKDLKLTLILAENLEAVMRPARNIAGLKLKQAKLLNTYEVLNGGTLVFMKESLDVLKQTFLK